MELSIISVESIKPSLPVHNHEPFKLSLFDQLAPNSYSPLILFYPLKNTYSINTTHILNRLKTSLSKTLDSFYPLSGRVRDNLFISGYNQGVPFTEAHVKSQLSDFLQGSDQLEVLNQFLPMEPYCILADPLLPQLAVQANMFDCGGMALGCTFFNKLGDGITGGSFLRSWAAITSGSYDKVIQPNLTEASSVFPPLEPPPPLTYENVLFKKGRISVRRFVFDANAITSLIEKSKSEIVSNPSGVQALTAFLWKSEMAAYRRVHKSQKPSMLMQVKEIRGATKPRMSEHSIGDLIWPAPTRVIETDMELTDLLVIVKEALDHVTSDFLKLTNIHAVLRGSSEIWTKDLDVFTCSNWSNFGFDDIDFGWGKPIWSALYGKSNETRLSLPNLALLKNVTGKKGAMEAWVALDEQVMNILENDQEFLTFASLTCCPIG